MATYKDYLRKKKEEEEKKKEQNQKTESSEASSSRYSKIIDARNQKEKKEAADAINTAIDYLNKPEKYNFQQGQAISGYVDKYSSKIDKHYGEGYANVLSKATKETTSPDYVAARRIVNKYLEFQKTGQDRLNDVTKRYGITESGADKDKVDANYNETEGYLKNTKRDTSQAIMQSTRLGADAQKYSKIIDKYYGAGTAKKIQEGSYGVAESADAITQAVEGFNVYSNIRKNYDSREDLENAIREDTINWSANRIDPDNVEARQALKAEKENRLAEIEGILSDMENGYDYPEGILSNPDEYNKWKDNQEKTKASLEKEKEKLSKSLERYNTLQAKIDAGEPAALELAKLRGEDPDDRYVQYVELSAELQRIKSLIDSGKNTETKVTPNGQVYKTSSDAYANEEYITADGEHTGMTNQEALEYYQAQLLQYERLYAPTDKYGNLQKLLESGAGFVADSGLANKVEQFFKMWDAGNRVEWQQDQPVYDAEGNEIFSGNLRMVSNNPNLSQTEQDILDKGQRNYWNRFTEGEREVIRYLYGSGQVDQADQYIQDMSAILGKREQEEYAKELSEASTLKKIALSVAGIPQRVIGGIPALAEDIAQTIKGEDINPYSYAHSFQNKGQAIEAQAAKDIEDAMPNLNFFGLSAGQVYQGLQSGIDSGVSRALFGKGSVVAMAMGAASSEAKELWEKGATREQIAVGASIAGIAEALFEYVSLEMAFKNFMESTPTSKMDFIKKALIQMGVEGSEEVATDIANLIGDSLNMHSQSEWAEFIKKYTDQGYSEAEAFGMAMWNDAICGKLWESFLGGALGTVFSTGGNFVKSLTGTYVTGANIKNSGVTDNFMQYANDVALQSPRSTVQESLEKAQANPSKMNLGFLAMAVNQETVKQSEADVDQALKENGIDDKTAKKVKNAFMSIVNDSEYELTDEEQQLLNDERVLDAYNQVFGEEGAVTERNNAYQEAMTPSQEDTATPESVRELLGPAGQRALDEAVSMGYETTDFVKAYLDGRMGTGALTEQETLPAVNASNSTDTMTRLAYNAGRADAIGNNALNAVQNAVKAITPSQNQAKRGEALAEGAKKLVGTSTKGMYGRTVVSSNPGLIQDKAYKKAGISKNQGRLTNSIANALRIQVRFDENLTNDRGQTLNGHYDQNTATITLSTSVKNPAMAILGHEMVHRIRNVSEEAYDALRDYVIQAMSDDSMKWVLGKRGELYNSKDSDFVTEEAVADAVGVLLGTSKNIQDRLTKEFATEKRNVLQKILDVIRDIAYAVRTKLSGSRKTLTANQIAEFEDLQSNLAAMENAIVNAMKQVAESVETAQTEAEENILGDTEDRHSIASLGEAMGFRLEREDGLIVAYDRNNNRVDKVTPKHVQDSGIGALINLARVNGHISASDATKQIKAAAELMNMIIHSQDSELVWKFAGAAMFSAVKSNSDGQYTTTIDFSTVCRKTQEMITAMSEAMTRLGRGLTKDEVTELQKDILTEKGTVPCPVCYVFSRWAGIGGVLDNMNKWMLKYDHSWDEGTKLADRVKELKAIKGDLQLLRETLRAEDSQYLYLEGEVEAIDAQQKELAAKRREAVKLAKKTGDYSAVEEIDKAKERLAKARKSFKDELNKIESKGSPEAAWLEKVRMQPGYWEEGILDKKTGKISKKGQKILFNLDGAEEFSKSSPLSWAYRTSRGPGIGKAILPYSDMKLGDLILGPDKTRSTGNRTFEKVYGEFDTDQKFAIATAIKRTLAQNLIGGQRFQSTSDFRYDYGLDYLQVFWEAQALGSNMQTYTKIVEFGELAATIGGDVNLSVMPRDAGHQDGHLVFSSVTGIDVEAAAKLNAMFDNVQLILVGINDEHIRLALEDSEETGGNIIGFVIPYHASGASINKFISALVSNLGEDFNELNYKDYSKLQTDGEAEWAGESEIRLREIRQRLLTGKIGNKNWKPSQEELALIKGKNKNISKYSFDELRDIEKKALAGDKNAIKEYKSWSAGVLWDVYQKMWVDSSSKNTYGVRLSGTQAEHIMPHEYWNKSVDRARAYINGFIFRSYCYNLGLTPRFTGISTDGREMGFGDFSDSTGYWKTLIDRPMYGNDGKYRDQQTLNVTNVSGEMLTPEYGEKQWGEFKVQEPSDVRAKKAADRFVKRVQLRSAVRESISSEENAKYMELAENPSRNFFQLEEMVRDAARAGDYNSPKLFHGTSAEFNSFDPKRSSRANYYGPGIYTTTEYDDSGEYAGIDGKWNADLKDNVDQYARSNADEKYEKGTDEWRQAYNEAWNERAKEVEAKGRILPLYGKMQNPFVVSEDEYLRADEVEKIIDNLPEERKLLGAPTIEAIREKVKRDRRITTEEVAGGRLSKGMSEALQKLGYDCIVDNMVDKRFRRPAGTRHVIFFDAERVKSASNVTYDDKGKIIPLKERFRTDRVLLDKWKNKDLRYSLVPVEDVEPTSNNWSRTMTAAEVRKLHPDLWASSNENADAANKKGNSTQTTSTTATYDKIFKHLINTGFKGKILDASSGLGLGTQLGRKYGLDVEDIEPYPGKGYTPMYTDYSTLNKQYPVVISNAVLNVLAQDERDAMVSKIGDLLEPGGTAYINVRTREELKGNKTAEELTPGQAEYFVNSNKAYQKGFAKQELLSYLEDALGPGFTVQRGAFGSGSNAIITKDANATRESIDYRETLDEMVKQYGKIPKGENPYRDVVLPKQTDKTKKVSQTVRTILEAEATPEDMVPNLEKLVAKKAFSYTTYTNEQAIEDATKTIKSKGWAETLAKWSKAIERGVVSKEMTAIGWALYNNAANSGDTETAVAIIRKMVAHQRNAAQAVQATTILKQLSPETQLYALQKNLDDLVEQLKKKYGTKKGLDIKINQLLAEQYLLAKTQEERDKTLELIYKDLARQLPTKNLERWHAWRYLCMLLNPTTHIRNIFGNAGFTPVVATKNLIATAIESFVGALPNSKLERTKAFLTGPGGARLIEAAFKDFKNVESEALGEGKYNDLTSGMMQIDKYRKIFGNTRFAWWNKSGGLVLRGLEFGNSWLLDKEDVLFSQPHYTFALAQYCKANGITAEQIKSGKGLDAARRYAIREAQKATYRDVNAISTAISRFGRKGTGGWIGRVANIPLEGLLPFRRTPVNIALRGLEYSPLGLLKSITYGIAQVKNGNLTGADFIDQLSAGLTGTGLAILGFFLAKMGIVRGRAPKKDKEKDFQELTGHQEYSIEWGDTSVTLDWLAPESMPFFLGVNLYQEIAQERDEKVKMKDIITAIGTVGDPLIKMSCLEGLDKAITSMTYAGDTGFDKLRAFLTSSVTSYFEQGLPTIAGKFEKMGEDNRQDTFVDKDSWLTSNLQKMLGRISNKVPKWEYQQIPYIDLWGREELTGTFQQKAFANLVNPSYVKTINESEMEKELERLYNATRDSGVLPSGFDSQFTVDHKDYYLTQEQYVQYEMAAGGTAYSVVGKLTESSFYKNFSDDRKAAAVQKAYTYAKQSARTVVNVPMTTTEEGWVKEAMEGNKKGISPAVYCMVAVLNSDKTGVGSLKDKSGKTITNSHSLLLMREIYKLNLTAPQREYLYQCFDVSGKLRSLARDQVDDEIKKMKGK